MKKLFAFVITAAFFAFSGHSVAQATCDALVINGVFDIQNTSVDEDRRLGFVNWARDRSESFNKNSGGGNIDIVDISMEGYGKFGLGGSVESVRQFWQDIENYDSTNTSQQTRMTGYVQKASEVIVKAFNDCINSKGLHVWIETTRDPRAFIVAAQFRSPGVPLQVTIDEDIIYRPINLSCSKVIKKGTQITGSTKRMLCVRNSDEEVTIVVNADSDPIGGGKLSLPAIRIPLTLSQKIFQGQLFQVWFNRISSPLGSIFPNVILTGRHIEGDFEITGPNNGGQIVTATYGCSPAVPSVQRGDCFSPLEGFLNIWGAIFIFDSGGFLYTRDRRLVGSVWVP